jgi:hypothetical protein
MMNANAVLIELLEDNRRRLHPGLSHRMIKAREAKASARSVLVEAKLIESTKTAVGSKDLAKANAKIKSIKAPIARIGHKNGSEDSL